MGLNDLDVKHKESLLELLQKYEKSLMEPYVNM